MNGGNSLRSRQFFQAFSGRPWSSTGIVQPVVLSLNWELGRKWGSYLSRHWSGNQGLCILGPTPVCSANLCALIFFIMCFLDLPGLKICLHHVEGLLILSSDVGFKCPSFKNKFLFNLSPECPHSLNRWASMFNT